MMIYIVDTLCLWESISSMGSLYYRKNPELMMF